MTGHNVVVFDATVMVDGVDLDELVQSSKQVGNSEHMLESKRGGKQEVLED